jgi:hypothetical protein
MLDYGRVAHPFQVANSKSQVMEGAPFFRVLCGRAGGDNAHSRLSICTLDSKLHTRIPVPIHYFHGRFLY